MSTSTNEALVSLAIQQLPAAIGMLRGAFAKANPDAPVPSDAEIIAGMEAAFRSSLARDEAWLAAHPEDGP